MRYISSRELFKSIPAHKNFKDFNRAIRFMPAYQRLVNQGHIVEYKGNIAVFGSSAETAPVKELVRTDGYKSNIYIDAVAQKEIEHHFSETAENAVQSSRESAALGVLNVNLEAIMRDKTAISILQLLSETAVAKQLSMEAKEAADRAEKSTSLLEARTDDLEDRVSKVDGADGYMTIIHACRELGVYLPMDLAKRAGWDATVYCNNNGMEVQKATDPRYGKVNRYPRDVAEHMVKKYAKNAAQAHRQ